MPKGKGRTPAQRAAQRAIDQARKPPTISMRAGADRRRSRKVMVAQRIQKLPIMPEIVDRIKDGWPDIEVARWIHQEGKLQEVSVDNLRLEVRRYRTQVMSPTETTARLLPQGVIEAAHMVQQATDELGELRHEISEHRDLLGKARRILSKMLDTAEPTKEEKPKAEGGEQKPAYDVPRRMLEAEGMTREEAQAYMTLCGEGVGNYVKLVDAQRKLALTSAQVKALLHVDDGSDRIESSEVIEARVVEYTKRRFAGRKDAMDVLGNPESRQRVMSIYQRALTDPKLQEDLLSKAKGEEGEDDPAPEIQ